MCCSCEGTEDLDYDTYTMSIFTEIMSRVSYTVRSWNLDTAVAHFSILVLKAMLLQFLLIPREAICCTTTYITLLLTPLKLATALSLIFNNLDYT